MVDDIRALRVRSMQFLEIALLAAAAAGCSNGGSSSSSVTNTSVSQAGTIVADPARNRIYVADAGNQRLLAFNSVSGALELNVPLASSPDGVASDARGAQVFVTLPSLHQIVTFDGSTFVQTGQFSSANALHAIAWRDARRVVVASDVALLLVDLALGTETAIIPNTPGNALIVQDHDHRRVWTAFSLNGELGVATIDPDLGGDVPAGNLLGPSVDAPVNLTLSYDQSQLFVGLTNTAKLDVIDAATISLTSTIAMPPALVALGPNVESTRLYHSPGDDSATDVPADTFTVGSSYLATAAILDRGVAVDTLGSNLLVHLANSTMEALPLFDDTLFGEPVLVTGTSYTLTLTGTPGEHFFLVGAARPGFIHYGPATAQPQMFVDLDLATVLVLAQGKLDGGGKATFTGTLDSGTIPEGSQYFLQAVVVDPTTRRLGGPTNPMRVTIFDP
jgi:DNA-binding beta-propeller fold protein YncE